ncbi:D-glycero-alpha-D-manno-heptose-1,7-bisphosphate 7-phosphatase [Rhodospirillum rubrum]|uniref:D,D-heptose 1,7-bisphosphate phosphatase n=2 Tax=Rhodospirillum rubrum TaxID=1085 RepID=Q2RND7_RHORT|nr:HAD family hydrolase [Rhodospirillum rubrum]ABC24358.1 D-alpha,beta-D-heptose 1,7-bisphosphate phosphatase [Rhodospirillum rubrum ATCC 11170]AEO50109.1 D-alpha,beta-D-heptose 1,7-bisphosphate phosphatase [Rhodospirillum rubrum F11]MBK5956080.1 HAD family hydrolase [Rhodospirillum rubrum]QXG80283.1 HAD family hydrolase [Rhodospirillum rubrum]HCF18594.1 HAD family hydrolase [Rhodospirillum rubrum]
MPQTRPRVVLLDRDGTLNEEVHYLARPDQLVLIPGAVAGLRRLRDLGLTLVVVTNQSGLERGYFSNADLEAIHRRLIDMLAAEGIVLAGIFVCPHGPDSDCECRKPKPGLVDAARHALGFDPAEAFMIGDKQSDLDLGLAVGALPILVRTGYGLETESAGAAGAAFVASDLLQASAFIAGRLEREKPRGTAAP